eukprot:5750393-Amphidinium_carterae.1
MTEKLILQVRQPLHNAPKAECRTLHLNASNDECSTQYRSDTLRNRKSWNEKLINQCQAAQLLQQCTYFPEDTVPTAEIAK